MKNNITNQKVKKDTRRSFIKLSTIAALASLYSIDMATANQKSLTTDREVIKKVLQDAEVSITRLKTNKTEYKNFSVQFNKCLVESQRSGDLDTAIYTLVKTTPELNKFMTTHAETVNMRWPSSNVPWKDWFICWLIKFLPPIDTL